MWWSRVWVGIIKMVKVWGGKLCLVVLKGFGLFILFSGIMVIFICCLIMNGN